MAEYLIFGARGQLGQAFLRALGRAAVGIERGEASLGDREALGTALARHRPRWVVNAAAYNHVDLAETRRLDALEANAVGPALLAELAPIHGFRLLHFSTDYVFGADALTRPRIEDDAPAPINFYGYTKLLGEQAVLQAGPNALVARVAHLFGGQSLSPGRAHLAERFLQLAHANRPIVATVGQRLNPTSVVDVVIASRKLMTDGVNGLYHLTGEGECSVAEFAAAVLEMGGVSGEIRAVEHDARPAPRSHHTVLDNLRLRREGRPAMPYWRESLAKWFADKQKSTVNG